MNYEPIISQKDSSGGRVFTPLPRRLELVDQFESSGLSAMKFAELAGVKYQTFTAWVKKSRQSRSEGAGEAASNGNVGAVRFVEISASAAGSAWAANSLCVELPNGARIRVSQAAQVPLAAQLIKALD